MSTVKEFQDEEEQVIVRVLTALSCNHFDFVRIAPNV
jgi:hypothetical protein